MAELAQLPQLAQLAAPLPDAAASAAPCQLAETDRAHDRRPFADLGPWRNCATSGRATMFGPLNLQT